MKLSEVNDKKLKGKIEGMVPTGAEIIDVEFYEDTANSVRYDSERVEKRMKIKYLYKDKEWTTDVSSQTGGYEK